MSRKCPALQGRPGRSQKGQKNRYSVNLEMAKAVYSNAWCSHSSRFRCVHVLKLSYTHFVTSHRRRNISSFFYVKIVYLSFRFLYGRVFLVVRRSGRLFSSPV